MNVFLPNGQKTSLDFNFGATPLPATLPLFATGLGVMGLLGWRRKRKSAVDSPVAIWDFFSKLPSR